MTRLMKSWLGLRELEDHHAALDRPLAQLVSQAASEGE
jgi:hypothetical protein